MNTSIVLTRRLESADAAIGLEFVTALARRHPQRGADSLSIAGGYALYGGPDSPANQVIGVGLEHVLQDEELDRIEDFYAAKGATVAFEACPLAQPATMEMLARRGYRPVEEIAVLVRSLVPQVASPALISPCVVREVTAAETARWASVVARGFFGDDANIPPAILEEIAAFREVPGALCLIAELGGEPAGGASNAITTGVAALYGFSTLPAYRGQGVQNALIAASLSQIAARGCDMALTHTLPNSTSMHNFQRHGFGAAYTRTKLSP